VLNTIAIPAPISHHYYCTPPSPHSCHCPCHSHSFQALNEFDLRATDWRKKLESQRGAVLAFETKVRGAFSEMGVVGGWWMGERVSE